MRARDGIYLTPDWANFIQRAAIRAQSFFQDAVANDTFVDIVKSFLDLFDLSCIFRVNFFHYRALQSIHCVIQFCFGMWAVEEFVHFVGKASVEIFHELLVGGLKNGFPFGFANFGPHFVLNIYQGLESFVAESQRINQDLFRNLIGTGFYHQDRVAGSCDPQVEIGFFNLRIGGIDNEFTVDPSNADCAYRAVPRDVRDGQRDRSRVDRQNIQRIFHIRREGIQSDLHIVAHVLGEQGADGAVCKAGDQNSVAAGPAFTAEE